MKKGGLTAKIVEEKLREHRGNMAAVGRELGVTRIAVYQFCKRRPKLMAVCADCRESMKDEGESSLYKAVLDGEGWAVCFYLKTQCRDRGYVEKVDHAYWTEEAQRLIALLASSGAANPGQAASPGAPSAGDTALGGPDDGDDADPAGPANEV